MTVTDDKIAHKQQPKAHPFVKWAGGKSRVVNHIKNFFPEDFNSYYEPFLGSAALYFAVSPRKGRLNDLNKALIQTYKVVRESVESLIVELTKIQDEYFLLTNIESKKDYYLKRREEFNSISTFSSVRRSALFIFLNKTGFNGMYRENKSGQYNIPFGKHDHPLICDESNLRLVSSDLSEIDLTSTSYEEAIRDVKPKDLVYLDPPYYPLTNTSNFTEYQAGGFTVEDQAKLRDVFQELDKKGCYVVMSNSACEEIDELYADFNINRIQVARAINSKTNMRGKIDEVIITNFSVESKI
jgi:DNA adenine methylase